MRDTHLLVKNKRGEVLIDAHVEEVLVNEREVIWTVKRFLGEERELHTTELALTDVAEISIAPYLTQDQQALFE